MHCHASLACPVQLVKELHSQHYVTSVGVIPADSGTTQSSKGSHISGFMWAVPWSPFRATVLAACKLYYHLLLSWCHITSKLAICCTTLPTIATALRFVAAYCHVITFNSTSVVSNHIIVNNHAANAIPDDVNGISWVRAAFLDELLTLMDWFIGFHLCQPLLPH